MVNHSDRCAGEHSESFFPAISDSGIDFLPDEHDSCTFSSEEEVLAVSDL
jgi:hypothetical protein